MFRQGSVFCLQRFVHNPVHIRHAPDVAGRKARKQHVAQFAVIPGVARQLFCSFKRILAFAVGPVADHGRKGIGDGGNPSHPAYLVSFEALGIT